MDEFRTDLAATLAPLWRALLSAERQVAADHGLTMWAYAALHRLAQAGAPVRGQAVLAADLGLDKTRLIPVLDDLQERGLIRREPDPGDRRARLLSLTPQGRRLFARAQRKLHVYEDQLLAGLDGADRSRFLRALATVSRSAGEAAAP
jgi:DNA-binding MarR family transcriptional regulator